MNLYVLGVALAVGVVIIFGVIALFARFYRKVEQGKALIVNKMRPEPEVTFTGMVVLPIFHKSEVMDISVKTIEIDRRGKDGLICRDNIRADIKVTFFVRVSKTRDDVVKVAQAIGCVRASDQGTLEELFNAKFSEALKTVGKQLDFVDLYTKRNEFRDQIVEVIGRDLNGYVLEDAAIDFLEQTPLSSLDANNILDAQGIRKITELTAIEHVRTNEYNNTARKQIKKQDVEASEAILSLERQEADARAKQTREIETVQARERAETMKVQAEEKLKYETARIKMEEEIAINEQNVARQVEVAQKNRERVVAVETERVEKDRALEAISREREVELKRISKEKELEIERKAIAEVVRERIVVDRTVAEQEERIKELRVIEEARRTKDAAIILAEGEAQGRLVKDIKEAEAAEQAAKFRARERLTLADAELEASDREARAKIRMAEGLQAESAAIGLGEVKVREAAALATEKVGLAEASVLREKGLAEAQVTRERLQVEAVGIAQKAESMKALDEAGRGHEEFRLRLESSRALETQAIEARRAVAEAQAGVLAEALKTAKIDIVGGESMFVDRIMSAVSMGKSVDGFIDRSDTMQTVLKDHLNGNASLIQDIKDVLSRPALSSGDVQSLTISALLARLIAQSDGEGRKDLNKLLEAARELGVDDLKV
jgi:uncharacterized membrane protein YqiK